MNSTLCFGDLTLIKKVNNTYSTNDIVYFKYPIKDSLTAKTVCLQRLIGMPGDTIQIIDKGVYINNFLITDTVTVKHNYYVKTNNAKLDTAFKLKYNLVEGGIISNDFEYSFSLTKREMYALKQSDKIKEIEIKMESKEVIDASVFPYSINYKWNMDNYGKLYLPKKNDTLILDSININLYSTLIKEYEKNNFEIKGDSFLINNVATKKYQVKQNYYFVMGDNRDNALDSRFFGFLPESFLKGKVINTFFKK